VGYQDLSDRFAATWWYPVIVGTALVAFLFVFAQHLADARWGRALFGLIPITFAASEMRRIVAARRRR
jgi:hypothetical protein